MMDLVPQFRAARNAIEAAMPRVTDKTETLLDLGSSIAEAIHATLHRHVRNVAVIKVADGPNPCENVAKEGDMVVMVDISSINLVFTVNDLEDGSYNMRVVRQGTGPMDLVSTPSGPQYERKVNTIPYVKLDLSQVILSIVREILSKENTDERPTTEDKVPGNPILN